VTVTMDIGKAYRLLHTSTTTYHPLFFYTS